MQPELRHRRDRMAVFKKGRVLRGRSDSVSSRRALEGCSGFCVLERSGSSHRSEPGELVERSASITVSTPESAGLPRLRERLSFLHGADWESEKVSDGFHHHLEFHRLDVGLVLRAKRRPLPFLVYVVIKLGREGDGKTCHRKVSPTFFERSFESPWREFFLRTRTCGTEPPNRRNPSSGYWRFRVSQVLRVFRQRPFLSDRPVNAGQGIPGTWDSRSRKVR